MVSLRHGLTDTNKNFVKKVMEKHTGIELFLIELENLLSQQELTVIEWKNRAMQAQDFDEAIRLKEVQWALQECLDKINPQREQQQKRKERVKQIFRDSEEKKGE